MAAITQLRVAAVEDDVEFRDALAAALASSAVEFRGCGTVREALALLATWKPEVVLLDLALPDGTAFDVLAVIRRRKPTPLVVAISGTATPPDAFRLAEAGVRAFLPKPFTMPELRAALERALTEPPDLELSLRGTVGRQGLRAVESTVRDRMVREALARSGGSRSAAAHLLRISRQLLQHILRGKPS
ncbi:MAG: response regulator [Deltaproteobacteria bacterium]|nr:response regulator [Deltaproteobacteria bacterium]